MIDMQALPEKINHWLARQNDGLHKVSSLQSANGGYSNITLLGELTHAHTRETSGIVLRIQPEGAAVFL